MPRAGRRSPLPRSPRASKARPPSAGSRKRRAGKPASAEAAARVTPRQALWLELMPFYIHEAWLLDERRFKEWLELFTDDVRYLEMRVARLDTGMAWGEDPPSRTRHLIGNLVAEPLSKGLVRVKTAFLVYRSHLETDHQLLAGSREDVLRRVNGAWKIAKRTILLDANVLLDKNLSIFL